MKISLRDLVRSNPLYIRYKYEHDKCCEDGWILQVSPFLDRYGEVQARRIRCKYCEIIDKHKKKKMNNAKAKAEADREQIVQVEKEVEKDW